MPAIKSINTGKPDWINFNGKKFRSSLNRTPIEGRIFVDTLGLEGDQVSDPHHHGGPDKALCVYCYDHFPFWEDKLSREMHPGQFGENLTLSGLTEKEIHIGDVFQIGDAEFQVSQPRTPCHKLNKIFNQSKLASWIQDTGFSGFYLRVIRQGWIQAGDEFKRVKLDSAGVSVYQTNDLLFNGSKNAEDFDKILSVEALSKSFRALFHKKVR